MRGLYGRRIFPWLLDRATATYDEDRRELLARASGRVLEIGVGGGATLSWYPPGVTEVVGIEPSPVLVERARRRLRELGAGHGAGEGAGRPRFALHEGSAEALAFPDGSFDTVVAFLVFCTIPDPRAAAAEAYRVLRPGGRLLVFEHVRAPDPRLARWQSRITPVWRRIAGGCHLDRDTRAVLEEAGFRFEELRSFDHPRSPPFVRAKIRGVAVKGGGEEPPAGSPSAGTEPGP